MTTTDEDVRPLVDAAADIIRSHHRREPDQREREHLDLFMRTLLRLISAELVRRALIPYCYQGDQVDQGSGICAPVVGPRGCVLVVLTLDSRGRFQLCVETPVDGQPPNIGFLATSIGSGGPASPDYEIFKPGQHADVSGRVRASETVVLYGAARVATEITGIDPVD